MSELREAIKKSFNGAMMSQEGVPYEDECSSIWVNNCIDSIIQNLPEPNKPFNIATELIDIHEGEINYKDRLVRLLEEAKS